MADAAFTQPYTPICFETPSGDYQRACALAPNQATLANDFRGKSLPRRPNEVSKLAGGPRWASRKSLGREAREPAQAMRSYGQADA